MKTIRVFEAFAGYGSQAMALKRLQHDIPDRIKFEFVGISEIEPYAIAAYNAVHGNTPNFGDISKIDWEQVSDFDLFTYSFPCQDISTAGKQKGFIEGSGSRSSLLWECRRAIEAKRPKFLLMENVKALVQKKFMPEFERWIDTLANLGYISFWQVLNAKDFGIPQNRERVFMVSIRGDATFEFPKPFPLEKRLRDVLEENVDESYYLKDEQVQRILAHCERKQTEGCGFKANFQDVRSIDQSEPLVLKFTDHYHQWDMTFRSDGYKLLLSRPCTLREFVREFIKTAPMWDKGYGARILTADNKAIFFDKELNETHDDLVIFNKQCDAHNGYGWRIFGLHLQRLSGGVCGTVTTMYGQRQTDTYLKVNETDNSD